MSQSKLSWAYGVTTVPERFQTTLPTTLESLALAGFDNPRLFVDGANEVPSHLRKYQVTFRYPRIKAFGNWILALWELWVRNPTADRFAIFQDDLVTYRNLRDYLEHSPYPARGYLNLYTFPQNQKQFQGWYLSNQLGKGAVGLVFNQEAVQVLLSQRDHIINRPLDATQRAWKAIDGAIVSALAKAGWKEYVHNPSLVQHTGMQSTLGNGVHDLAESFRGRDYDARELIRESQPKSITAVPEKVARRQRIGLVGYNCRTGLGTLNREIAEYSDCEAWFIKPHAHHRSLPNPDNVDVYICPQGSPSKIERFLRQVDIVVFCETPYYNSLIDISKRLNKRLVCIPMMEWMPPGAKGWPQDVDLFLCPTKDCYDQFSHVIPCHYFPWPVDTRRFSFQERTECKKFLFVNGNGGWGGRKGANVIKEAKRLWPEMPLLVRSQTQDDWPPGTEFLGEVDDNTELYREGDVLIAPHSVDGLGLEPREAMACGMPVITTDGAPWNEIPSIGKIRSLKERRKVRRPVVWHLPDPSHLVEICRGLLGQNISQESHRARKWAEDNSWVKKAEEFNNAVRYLQVNQLAGANR